MVKSWLKVTPLNKKYMEALVNKLAERVPNVFKPGKPGVLFAGMTTNMCTKFQDLESDILAEMEALQASHTAMTDGSGDPKKLNTFYLNPVAEVGDGRLSSFGPNSKATQQFGMAAKFLEAPFGA